MPGSVQLYSVLVYRSAVQDDLQPQKPIKGKKANTNFPSLTIPKLKGARKVQP